MSEPKIKSAFIREIRFKEDSSVKSRKAFIAKLDNLNPNKVISVSKNYKSAVIAFDDAMDMTAFMIASGLVKTTRKGIE
jgi:hypothetical protein